MTKKLTQEEKDANKILRANRRAGAAQNQPAIIRGGGSTGAGEDPRRSEGESGGSSSNSGGSIETVNGAGGLDRGEVGTGNQSSDGNSGSSPRTSGGGNGNDNRGSIGEGGRIEAGSGSGSGSNQPGGTDSQKGSAKLVNLNKPKIIKPADKGSKKADPKKKADLTDSDTLTDLIVNVSTNYAKVTRRGYWAIPEDEAKTIADPASIVLQSIPKKQIERINKFIAPVALITACITVVAPRVMMDIAVEQEKRRIANVNKSQVGTVRAGGTLADPKQSGSNGSGQAPKDTGSENVSVNAPSEVAGIFESMDQGAGSYSLAE